jgi:XamI restriction endonuclease
MPTQPIRWTAVQFEADARAAREIFRNERVGEPLALYENFFATFAAIFRETIGHLRAAAANPVDPELIADLVDGRNKQKAFRYLAAPPISEDDLKALADTSLAPTVLAADPDKARRVRDTVLALIDPFRFPWIPANRAPTTTETETAVIASAVIAAAKEVETHRRRTQQNEQEQAVKDLLAGIGLHETPAREIPMLTAAPDPGSFCGESRLAGTRADVVVRLYDGRVMAIECKVSNSSVNSYKRLVHDTGGKASTWYRALGDAQVVPAAVMSGVYSVANLEDVQNNKRVALYWQQRLQDLADFVLSTAE